MVLLKVVCNTCDGFDFDVDDEMDVVDTRAMLQEMIGHDATRLRLSFRGQQLIDGMLWGSLSPPVTPNEKLYVSVVSKPLDSHGSGNRSSGSTVGATAAPRVSSDRDNARAAQRMEPIIAQMANNPALVDFMINSSPELQYLIREHPQVERELRDPETLAMIMRSQYDPDARRALNTSMDMQMAQLNAIPGGMQMLERYFGDMAREADVASMGTATEADRREATVENSTPNVRHTANNESLPNPWARNNRPPPAAISSSAAATMAAANNPFAQFGVIGQMPMPSAPPPPPLPPPLQQQYSAQLAMLKEMGFEDEALCIEALVRMKGDVDDSVMYIAEKHEEQEQQQQ